MTMNYEQTIGINAQIVDLKKRNYYYYYILFLMITIKHNYMHFILTLQITSLQASNDSQKATTNTCN